MSSVASASAAADYDPSTDPKRKAKSKDPGWKYGYWPEIGNRDKVMCILCNTTTKGGIKRLKEHLAGGYSDVLMCSNTTTTSNKASSEAGLGDPMGWNTSNRSIHLGSMLVWMEKCLEAH